MVLTHEAILRELAAGRLEIDPFTDDQVGPASIDLHLGDEIRVMDGGGDEVAVTDDADYRSITRLRSLDRPYVLGPGETILGITRERIRLPPDVAGWLEGRSRYARLGLMIHVTAGFVAPGVNSRQVLEMSNVAEASARPSTPACGSARSCSSAARARRCTPGRFARQERL